MILSLVLYSIVATYTYPTSLPWAFNLAFEIDKSHKIDKALDLYAWAT